MTERWGWDDVPNYQLDQEKLDQWLRNKFGNYNFFTQVRLSHLSLEFGIGWLTMAKPTAQDKYSFWIPRKLTEVHVPPLMWRQPCVGSDDR